MTPLLAALVVCAMPQPFGPLEYCSHEVVLGQPQTGKTEYVRERVRLAARVVIATPHPVSHAEDGLRVYLDNLLAEPELLDGAYMRLVVPLGDDDEEEDTSHEQVTRLVRFVRREAPRRGSLVLVLDEVGDYSQRCAATLTKLHRNGHHRGVASILVSQCAVDIPLSCRRTATLVASFLQTRSEDLASLSQEYGEDFAEQARTWRKPLRPSDPWTPPAVWTLPTMYGGRT